MARLRTAICYSSALKHQKQMRNVYKALAREASAQEVELASCDVVIHLNAFFNLDGHEIPQDLGKIYVILCSANTATDREAVMALTNRISALRSNVPNDRVMVLYDLNMNEDGDIIVPEGSKMKGEAYLGQMDRHLKRLYARRPVPQTLSMMTHASCFMETLRGFIAGRFVVKYPGHVEVMELVTDVSTKKKRRRGNLAKTQQNSQPDIAEHALRASDGVDEVWIETSGFNRDPRRAYSPSDVSPGALVPPSAAGLQDETMADAEYDDDDIDMTQKAGSRADSFLRQSPREQGTGEDTVPQMPAFSNPFMGYESIAHQNWTQDELWGADVEMH